MNRRDDEYGELLSVFTEETKYLKTYDGKVLETTDELEKGRVRIQVPELGWMIASECPWVDQEYPGRGCIVPNVDDWVVVYFIAGDVARPRYRSRTSAIEGGTPGSFDGVNKKVLFDDGETVIVYDDEEKQLSITGPKKIIVTGDGIELNGADYKLVLHDKLVDILEIFMTALNAHVHTSASPGSPTSQPSVPLELDIADAATTTISTGG